MSTPTPIADALVRNEENVIGCIFKASPIGNFCFPTKFDHTAFFSKSAKFVYYLLKAMRDCGIPITVKNALNLAPTFFASVEPNLKFNEFEFEAYLWKCITQSNESAYEWSYQVVGCNRNRDIAEKEQAFHWAAETFSAQLDEYSRFQNDEPSPEIADCYVGSACAPVNEVAELGVDADGRECAKSEAGNRPGLPAHDIEGVVEGGSIVFIYPFPSVGFVLGEI